MILEKINAAFKQSVAVKHKYVDDFYSQFERSRVVVHFQGIKPKRRRLINKTTFRTPNEPPIKMKNRLKIFFVSVYILLVVFLSVREYKKQEYNWDMLPYMAVVLSHEDNDMNAVHHEIFQTTKEQVPASDYNLLIDGGVTLRKLSAENTDYFRDQLPFYTVKPLYTGVAYGLYKAGIPLTKATVLPAAISYFLIAVLVFYWIQKYTRLFFAVAASLLVMLCRPLISTGSVSTPDCLSALFLLSALYCVIEKQSLATLCILLVMSIFTRLDNIIPAVFIILVLTFTNKFKIKISAKQFLFIAMLFGISFFLVTFPVKKYGWNIFYYPSFISHLNQGYDSRMAFSISNYFSVAYSQALSGLFFSWLPMFFLLGLVLFVGNISFRLKSMDPHQLLFSTFVLIIFIRFILQPAIADRFYIPYYVATLIFVIKKFGSKFERKSVHINGFI